MKLPSNPLEPDFSDDFTAVSFYPNKCSDLTKQVNLPKWLSQLINRDVQAAYSAGKRAKLGEIKEILDIRS